MIGADVGHHRDARLRDRQSTPQDAAAGGFDDRRARAALADDATRTLRPGVITARPGAALEEHPVGAAVGARPAVSERAGREQPHRRGLAVRAGHDGGGHVVQLAPRHRGGRRQRRQGEIEPTAARPQGERFLVEYVWQGVRLGGAHQRPKRRPRLAGREFRQARERGAFLQHRRQHPRALDGILEHLREQRRLECSGAGRIGRGERGAQRPLVDLGGDKQLINGRRERQRHAAGVPAGDDPRGLPPQVRARPLDARAPAGQQRLIGRDAAGLQLRARADEE